MCNACVDQKYEVCTSYSYYFECTEIMQNCFFRDSHSFPLCKFSSRRCWFKQHWVVAGGHGSLLPASYSDGQPRAVQWSKYQDNHPTMELKHSFTLGISYPAFPQRGIWILPSQMKPCTESQAKGTNVQGSRHKAQLYPAKQDKIQIIKSHQWKQGSGKQL